MEKLKEAPTELCQFQISGAGLIVKINKKS